MTQRVFDSQNLYGDTKLNGAKEERVRIKVCICVFYTYFNLREFQEHNAHLHTNDRSCF